MKKATAILSILLAALLALTACAAAPETSEDTPTARARSHGGRGDGGAHGDASSRSFRPYTLNVPALLGPTGIGMVKLMNDADSGLYADQFDANITLSSAPDEISGKLITGELDIACVPTNLAAVLYSKTRAESKWRFEHRWAFYTCLKRATASTPSPTLRARRFTRRSKVRCRVHHRLCAGPKRHSRHGDGRLPDRSFRACHQSHRRGRGPLHPARTFR